MNLKAVINSKWGMRLVEVIGTIFPPSLGHIFSDVMVRWIISHPNNPQVRAVRTNQWVIHGKGSDQAYVDCATRAVFQHSGRCLYDMYHYYNNPSGLNKKVELSQDTFEYIERSRKEKYGVLVVGPHLSNFDLCIRTLGFNGMQALVLSYPNPSSSYQMQNELRTMNNMEAIPLTISALRKAMERLKSGGIVLTGVERPIEKPKYTINFFGEPAALPVTHVQLALNARVPVIIIAGHMRPDGTYYIETTEELKLRPNIDHKLEITRNAEMILERLEAIISLYPQQWLMLYPVWPQLLELAP
jgi:phosphatidylinositol dimannoside acyltransferase